MVRMCIAKGWSSVMYDGSALSYTENLRNTRRVVSWAHKKGIAIEAELGAIKGKEDVIDVSARQACFTDPEQAQDFVYRTGIDALAISIGTAHGPFKFEGETILDYARLKNIASHVRIPLVLHGASGN